MKKRYFCLFLLFAIVIIVGILKVNIQYNKANGNAYKEENFKNIYEDEKVKKSDVFAEFVINKSSGTELKIYYISSPFDLRFCIGNKIIYINSKMFKHS